MAEPPAHGNDVADGFINRVGGHVIGVDVAIARADAVGHDDPFHRVRQRTQDSSVARTVVVRADEWLDDAGALYLVIVLADDPFLAADVKPAQQLQQRRRQIGGAGKRRLGKAGGLPASREAHFRQPVVQKRHLQQGDGIAIVAHVKQARIGKRAQNRRFHLAPRRQRQKRIEPRWGYGEGHAFLGFRNQNLPGIEARILKRRPLQVQLTAITELGHFAHRGRQSASAVVGNAAV